MVFFATLRLGRKRVVGYYEDPNCTSHSKKVPRGERRVAPDPLARNNI